MPKEGGQVNDHDDDDDNVDHDDDDDSDDVNDDDNDDESTWLGQAGLLRGRCSCQNPPPARS